MISQIFFDLDGVLCDFAGGSAKLHGKPLDKTTAKWDFFTEWGMTADEFWAPINNNPAFWANLEPLPDGMELLDRVMEIMPVSNVCVLSSGMCPGSVEGKRAWLKKHIPWAEKGASFCSEKWRVAAPCKMLIDDHDANINDWWMKRGNAISAPRSWNVRRESIDARGNFNVNEVMKSVTICIDFKEGKL